MCFLKVKQCTSHNKPVEVKTVFSDREQSSSVAKISVARKFYGVLYDGDDMMEPKVSVVVVGFRIIGSSRKEERSRFD